MSRKDTITMEQLDMLIDHHYPIYLREGLRTGPANLEAVRPVINEWYKRDGAPHPEFQQVQSPIAAETLARKHLGTSGYVGTFCWGAQDIYWLALHEFAALHLGVTYEPSDLQMLQEHLVVARNADWVYMLNGLCLVSDSPVEIHFEELPEGRVQLHHDGGRAILYSDGWGLSALWGIIVPDWLVDTPAEQISPEKLMQIENADVRRVGIRKVGVTRLLSQLKARTLDRDSISTMALDDAGNVIAGATENHPYELLEFNLPSTEIPSRALRMTFPCTDIAVVEMVPPWIKTCSDARAWRDVGGSTLEEFAKNLTIFERSNPDILR